MFQAKVIQRGEGEKGRKNQAKDVIREDGRE
jgi:hypothetical protein